jgi:hypothetical protein
MNYRFLSQPCYATPGRVPRPSHLLTKSALQPANKAQQVLASRTINKTDGKRRRENASAFSPAKKSRTVTELAKPLLFLDLPSPYDGTVRSVGAKNKTAMFVCLKCRKVSGNSRNSITKRNGESHLYWPRTPPLPVLTC